jgi:Putative phage abortive infection protein
MSATDRIAARRRTNRRVFWGMLIAGIVILSALIALNASHFGWELSNDQKRWAEFGEYLGGILGPAFAYFAFLVLLLTFQDQNLKIEEDRIQLEEERARGAMRDFESTFFQLLHRFSEVVSDMRFSTWTGREAVMMLFNYFKTVKAKDNPQQVGMPRETYCEELYGKLYEEQQHVLGIYFRTLYHIFKFIDTSALTHDEKAQYASIARAQLSAYELGLIFYNGLWEEGKQGFKPMITKYGILKHAKPEVLLQDADDRHNPRLYEETAFLGYKRRLERWNGKEPPIHYD